MQDMRDDFHVEHLHPADSLSEIHSDCYTPTVTIGSVKVESLCCHSHGIVLLGDNGSGRARSGYPPPVMLKWDLGCARAEEVIMDQGGLVLKQS
ncbi:hypothetical protein R3I94_006552 [Phoxinus phoxinus]